MTNPYATPPQMPQAQVQIPSVRGPAISLIVVASIAVLFGLFGLATDVLLVASGAIEQLEASNEGQVSKYTSIAIRTAWGVLLLMVSSFVLYGAVQMLRYKNYGLARGAAVAAAIPCIGPCFFLGIPFGIWALVVLSQPQIKDAFR